MAVVLDALPSPMALRTIWRLGPWSGAFGDLSNERVYRQLLSAGLMTCFDFEENDGMSATLTAEQQANYMCSVFELERTCIVAEDKPRLLNAVN